MSTVPTFDEVWEDVGGAALFEGIDEDETSAYVDLMYTVYTMTLKLCGHKETTDDSKDTDG